ncbi:MAG: hypothetical protein QG625_2836, partial [Cyanobacteriota bacterium erpe_2018_sw_39hr_WHONDRS-SW48-000098_B_bin.30]|nr:hypothetical protein [Cyanobacteriota bacterium erpe_2018_sw_39hr_WHONDRS-SW48-000098_B_bin.30]
CLRLLTKPPAPCCGVEQPGATDAESLKLLELEGFAARPYSPLHLKATTTTTTTGILNTTQSGKTLIAL